MKRISKPEGARRTRHPKEERADDTPLRDLVLGAVNCEVVKDERELIEALFLGYLEVEDEERARVLIESNDEARAYWAELAGDDSESEAAIRQLHEQVVARMPWLKKPGRVDPDDATRGLASLRLPQAPGPADSGSSTDGTSHGPM